MDSSEIKTWPPALPWAGDRDLEVKLELAGWRYAALIGTIEPEGDEELTPQVLQADKARYPHFIMRTECGLPFWDFGQAVTFVCDQVGCSREVAAAWLDFDWDGGGGGGGGGADWASYAH